MLVCYRVVRPSGQIVLLTSCEMEKFLLHQIDHADGVTSRGDNCLPASDHKSVPKNKDPPVTLQTSTGQAGMVQHGEKQKVAVDKHYTDRSERNNGYRQKKNLSNCESPENDKSKIKDNDNSSRGLKILNVNSNSDRIDNSVEECSGSLNKQLFEMKDCSEVFKSNGGEACAAMQDSLKLHWAVGESFYIKLGETHSKICTFQKKLL